MKIRLYIYCLKLLIMGLPYFYQIHFWFADHHYYMAKYFVKQLDRKFYLFSIIILKDIFNVYKKVYHHDYIKGKENPWNLAESNISYMSASLSFVI